MSRISSVVALKENVSFSSANLNDALAEQYPSLKITELDVTGEAAFNLVFKINNQLCTVMYVDVPPPSDMFADSVNRTYLWPEAREAMSSLSGMILLSCGIEDDTFESRRETAKILTILSSVICDLARGVGIEWNPNGTVVDATSLEDASLRAYSSRWPVDLWCFVQPYADKTAKNNDGIGGITLGIAYFIGREIQFEANDAIDEGKLINLLWNIGNYLLDHGLIMKPGQTLGPDANTKIAIEFREQSPIPETPVVYLKQII